VTTSAHVAPLPTTTCSRREGDVRLQVSMCHGRHTVYAASTITGLRCTRPPGPHCPRETAPWHPTPQTRRQWRVLWFLSRGCCCFAVAFRLLHTTHACMHACLNESTPLLRARNKHAWHEGPIQRCTVLHTHAGPVCDSVAHVTADLYTSKLCVKLPQRVAHRHRMAQVGSPVRILNHCPPLAMRGSVPALLLNLCDARKRECSEIQGTVECSVQHTPLCRFHACSLACCPHTRKCMHEQIALFHTQHVSTARD
jgi:hypothetical protein